MAVTRSISQSNVIHVYTATHDAASLAANLMREDAVTVTGVLDGDTCLAWYAPIGAAMGFGQAIVTADDEITVQLINSTVGAVDLASGTYTFVVARGD